MTVSTQITSQNIMQPRFDKLLDTGAASCAGFAIYLKKTRLVYCNHRTDLVSIHNICCLTYNVAK